MMYLMDTHIALWAIDDTSLLSNKAKAIMENDSSNWFFSHASVWEVAIKHVKHPDQFKLSSVDFCRACRAMGVKDLPLQLDHIIRTELLPVESSHGDPFDRMLLTQAKYEDMLLVTHDKSFAIYDDPHVLMV